MNIQPILAGGGLEVDNNMEGSYPMNSETEGMVLPQGHGHWGSPSVEIEEANYITWWSDARAVWNFWIHKQGESTRLKIYFYVTAI